MKQSKILTPLAYYVFKIRRLYYVEHSVSLAEEVSRLNISHYLGP